MNICIKCDDIFNTCLETIMIDEGDTITDVEPELIITDHVVDTKGVPFVRVGGRMNQTTIQALGYEKGTEVATVSCWYDRFSLWGKQLILSIPVWGMMNQDLGKRVCTGVGMRYVDESPLKELFLHELLNELLKTQKHTGFVSIGIDVKGNPLSVSYGIPHNGNLVVLEGCKQRLSEFFSNPSRLMESWAIGILVSRYPYPMSVSSKRVFVKGIRPATKKHIYTPLVVNERNSFYTDSSVIGLCTAWDKRLIDTNKRALGFCNSLEIPEKQYRTDLNQSIQHTWAELTSHNLISYTSEMPLYPESQMLDVHSSLE